MLTFWLLMIKIFFTFSLPENFVLWQSCSSRHWRTCLKIDKFGLGQGAGPVGWASTVLQVNPISSPLLKLERVDLRTQMFNFVRNSRDSKKILSRWYVMIWRLHIYSGTESFLAFLAYNFKFRSYLGYLLEIIAKSGTTAPLFVYNIVHGTKNDGITNTTWHKP